MNRVLPVLSLCLALLALAAALVPRGDSIVVSSPPVEVPVARDSDPELRKRIEQLEDDNRALWDRVVLLEHRQPSASDGGAGSPGLAAEVAELREQVRGVVTGEVLTNDASRAALKDVIREAEADSQRERLVQRQQRQEQRVEEQKAKWKDFFATAKLTWPQQQELEKRLAEEEAARRAIAEQLQNGGPNPDAFRALRDQRKETDQAMGKLLDDTQKEQYQALRREDRGGRGGPGADQLR